MLSKLQSPRLGLQVHHTKRPLEAMEVAEEAFNNGVREFVAVGGDGTAFEVANGILPSALSRGVRVKLGVLPLGTGNSLVEHFATNSQSILDCIESGKTRPFDVLRLQHSEGELVALSTITLGVSTLVAQTANRYLKPLRAAAYPVGALLEIVRLTNLRVRCSLTLGTREATFDQETPLLALQNTATFGKGMRVAPGALTADGVGEMVLVDPTTRWQLLKTLPKLYNGSHLGHPAVGLHRFNAVRFEDQVPRLVMIDGETRTLVLESLSVEPSALDLFI